MFGSACSSSGSSKSLNARGMDVEQRNHGHWGGNIELNVVCQTDQHSGVSCLAGKGLKGSFREDAGKTVVLLSSHSFRCKESAEISARRKGIRAVAEGQRRRSCHTQQGRSQSAAPLCFPNQTELICCRGTPCPSLRARPAPPPAAPSTTGTVSRKRSSARSCGRTSLTQDRRHARRRCPP